MAHLRKHIRCLSLKISKSHLNNPIPEYLSIGITTEALYKENRNKQVYGATTALALNNHAHRRHQRPTSQDHLFSRSDACSTSGIPSKSPLTGSGPQTASYRTHCFAGNCSPNSAREQPGGGSNRDPSVRCSPLPVRPTASPLRCDQRRRRLGGLRWRG